MLPHLGNRTERGEETRGAREASALTADLQVSLEGPSHLPDPTRASASEGRGRLRAALRQRHREAELTSGTRGSAGWREGPAAGWALPGPTAEAQSRVRRRLCPRQPFVSRVPDKTTEGRW